MDFEEQLEKAEKLPTPSLVGASLRSADDSEHQNYIHPEKSRKSPKSKTSKKDKSNSLLNSQLGASLDDLISEGALLGSDEDFTNFLDEEGHVKDDAKYNNDLRSPLREEIKLDAEPESAPQKENKDEVSAKPAQETVYVPDEYEEEEIDATPKPKKKSSTTSTSAGGASSIYQNKDYSTPNLSEYQLDNQITEHKDLLTSVQSYDINRLPTGSRSDYSVGSDSATPSSRPKPKKTASFSTPSLVVDDETVSNADIDYQPSIGVKDGIHTPYFQRDGRSSSRSRTRAPDSARSGSRSRSRPHLARGDSYKNTHDEDPSRYELPPKFQDEVEAPIKEEAEPQLNDRVSRMARPTMGDSIAAIEEAAKEDKKSSLVTTGDYTNFDVDTPTSEKDSGLDGSQMFATRSISSTNYLRSISRSRSRQPNERNPSGTSAARGHSLLNEKNDADTAELEKEGALINDDPFSTIDGLDTMVEEVLHLHDNEKKTPIEKSGEKKTSIESVDEKKTPIESVDEKKTPIDSDEVKKTPIETEGEKKTPIEDEESSEVAEPKQIAEEKKIDRGGIEKEIQVAEAVDTSESKSVAEVPLESGKDEAETELKSDEKKVEAHEAASKAIETEVAEKEEAEETEEKGDSTGKEVAPVIPKSEKEEVEVEEPTKDTVPHGPEEVDTEIAEPTKEDIEEGNVELVEPTKKESDAEETEVKEIESEKKDADEPKEAVESEKKSAEATEEKEVESEKKDAEIDEPALKEIEPETKVAEAEESEAKEIEPEKKEIEEPTTKEIETQVPEKKEIDTTEPQAEEVEPSAAKELTSGSAAAVEPKQSEKDDSDLEDLDVSPEELRKHLEAQPVYIFTSLAGGMQIMTRTNRLSTILNGNGVKYTYRDLGTDEEAKKIWRRYSNGKLLPGVVRGDDFIGNFNDIEEANEEYKVRELLYETL